MDNSGEMRKIGPYYDNKNYPRGFSKHGDFTISQANALHEYGKTMELLAKGELSPENLCEQRFLNVCRGELEPESVLEKAWLAYQRRLAAKSTCVSPFGTSPRIEDASEEDFVDDSDDDTEDGDDELVA